MLALALLVISGPKTLHETPEWKAFHAALASKPQWMVLVMNKQQNGNNFQFGAIKGGLQIGWSEKIQYVWDGKKGISLDWRTKTWKPIPSKAELDRFFRNGVPFFMEQWDSIPTKLVGYDATGKKSKTGWQFRDQGRDYEWEGTYWFDDKTHMLSEYYFSGRGMVSLPDHAGMYNLYWTFDKKQMEGWSLDPPKDFKRGDSKG
jgi:hypothetical protein